MTKEKLTSYHPDKQDKHKFNQMMIISKQLKEFYLIDQQ